MSSLSKRPSSMGPDARWMGCRGGFYTGKGFLGEFLRCVRDGAYGWVFGRWVQIVGGWVFAADITTGGRGQEFPIGRVFAVGGFSFVNYLELSFFNYVYATLL